MTYLVQLRQNSSSLLLKNNDQLQGFFFFEIWSRSSFVNFVKILKMRLDKAELKKEQAEKERIEQDLNAQENKIRLLEDNLDQSEERVSKLTQQLTAAETVTFT